MSLISEKRVIDAVKSIIDGVYYFRFVFTCCDILKQNDENFCLSAKSHQQQYPEFSNVNSRTG